MLGAIIGDIVGSAYEFNNTKKKDFHLFTPKSKFTDDTVMTLAVAEWLTVDKEHSKEGLVLRMQTLGRHVDAMKLRSSMTLFDAVRPNDVFGKVLDAFYHGNKDERTLREIGQNV